MREYRGLRLDPFQRQALQAIRAGHSVIVAAPTGCGKTLIAEYALEQALSEGLQLVYTAPIKALSNQKFRDFSRTYPGKVGLTTGDVTLNPDAPVQIMTTEIFRHTIFESPERLKHTRYVIFDEVHYLDDPDRGTVWEESIMFAPDHIRVVGLSATIQNLDQFAAWIRFVRPGELKVVVEKTRPVPLTMRVFNGSTAIDPKGFKPHRFPEPEREGTSGRGGRGGRGGRDTRGGGRRSGRRGKNAKGARGHGRESHQQRGQRGRQAVHMAIPQRNQAVIREIMRLDQLPCIFFIFSRAYTERAAAACFKLSGLVTPAEKRKLSSVWDRLAEEFQLSNTDPVTRRLQKLVERGVAYHHAGMLPTHKEVIERLFNTGLLKLLFATETFALGVNMPARAVCFESLRKFDGVKVDYMKTRSFLQMAGRAGRRGIDDAGFVYANIDVDEDTPRDCRRVMLGEVEEVSSQFRLSYGAILSLWARLGEGIYEAVKKSFAYFRHKKKKGAYYEAMVALIRKRLQLLREQGYVIGRNLTEKGQFASRVHGFEIELTELMTQRVIEGLSAPQVATMLAAVVYEGKREVRGVTLPRNLLQPLDAALEKALRAFRQGETDLQLPALKDPDWRMSSAVWAWAHGSPFEELRDFVELAPGDIVRVLRQSLQLLRQLRRPLEALDRTPAELTALRRLLADTTACLKRDVVDAELQLRRAVEVDEPRATPPKPARPAKPARPSTPVKRRWNDPVEGEEEPDYFL